MTLAYDSPVLDPAGDALDRAPFAGALADAIATMDADAGFVFALHGAWGSGKTTVINFVLHMLETRDSATPVVVHFNPWWFSGRDQLIQQFFNAFRAELGAKSGAEQVGELAKDLDKFARVLTPLTFVPTLAEPVRSLRTMLTGVSESGKAISETMRADAHAIRQEIDARLRARGDKILVVIDDLDRLPPAEIRLVFQLVKAVADFPKTIYLLAFDHDLVSSALSEEQVGSGGEYLAKIVQAPFDLPAPPRAALDRLFFERLDTTLAGTDDHLFDQVAWGNLFMEGVQQFIRTPRDVKRLMNAISPAYPPVKNEVSAHEFIAMQALRVYAPKMYSEMALSKEHLAGEVPNSIGGQDRRGAWRTRFEALLSECPEQWREVVGALLKQLFPRWEYAFGGSAHGPDWLARWRREGRVCSPDAFDLFFRLALPQEAIGLREYQALIDASADPEDLANRLREMAGITLLDGRSKVRLFLDGIQDFTESGVPDQAIGAMLEGIWLAGDELLIESDGRGLFTLPNSMQIIRIAHQLLRRLPDSAHRLEVLRTAMEHGRAVELSTRELSIRYQGLEEHQESDDNLLDRIHVDELRAIVLEQIHEAAATGSLARTPGLGYMLYRWEEWEPGAGVAFAQALAQDSKGFANIVGAFSSESFSAGISDHVSRSRLRVSLDGLETFLETSSSDLEARAQDLLADAALEIAADERSALELVASGRGSRAGRDDLLPED